MKYALIGCGRIAVNHIKAAQNNNLDIVAVCDRIPDQISLLSKKTNIDITMERYFNYIELLDNHPELELVAIATESGSHAEIALECINRGINLIIEKPIAMSMQDADKIIALSKVKGVKVSACHQNRFNLAVQRMRHAVEDGRFGKLSHGSVHVRWNRDLAYYEQAPWRGKWESDGGALMNQCIHGIDLLRWMMGDEVNEVYGVTRQQFHDFIECEDIGLAVIKFNNGAIATVEGTVNVFPKNLEETLYLFGQTGTVKLGGLACNKIDVWDFSITKKEDTQNFGLHEISSNVYGNGHISLYADVINAIKYDRIPYVDALAGKNALEVVLAIYKSQLTGLPVKLPLKEFTSADMVDIFGEGTI